jgi:hypothetical protein
LRKWDAKSPSISGKRSSALPEFLLPSLFPGGFSLSSSKELFLACSSRSQAQIIRWLACSALKAYTAGLAYLGTTALKIRTDFA